MEDQKIGKTLIKLGEKGIIEIFFYLDKPGKNREEFANLIVNQVPYNEDVGYAGYRSRSGLRRFLLWSIYRDGSEELWKEVRIRSCIENILAALSKCAALVNNKTIRIFIFPTHVSFVIKKMAGVTGSVPWKNTILLNICLTTGWERALQNTVIHELAHALALNFNERTTIQDYLVFDGVAEHFREHFLGGEKADWVKSITKEKAREILQEIRPRLESEDKAFYRELFFGAGNFPLWAGYAIGYYIVEGYLKKVGKRDWGDILKILPSRIMKDSDF